MTTPTINFGAIGAFNPIVGPTSYFYFEQTGNATAGITKAGLFKFTRID